jgi:hypothetical protein
MPSSIPTTLDDSESMPIRPKPLFSDGVNQCLKYSYGNIITSTSDFQAFWTTVAKEFASNSKVVFDTSEFV